MNRSAAERRHHRSRVIRNRLKLIENAFNGNWGLGKAGPGGLDKDHLTNCSCWACGGQHYREFRAEHERRWKRESGSAP